MIATLTGSNTYELQLALRSIKQAFVQLNGNFAIELVDAGNIERGAFIDLVTALPFLSPRRMVIIENLASNKQITEFIEEVLAATSDQTDVYIVEPKLDKRSILYKTLNKLTEFKEFTQIDVQSAPQWLVQQAVDRGGVLSINDARYMVERMGVNQMALSNQLDVLMLYSPNVNVKAIDLLTDKTPQSSIFDVLEAAFGGSTQRALELYDDQRAQNVEPLAIEALFVWQLHILLLVKAAILAKKQLNQLGISPYVAQKSANLVTRRSLSQVKTYVQKLTELEYALKTTSIDADDAMKNFIVVLGQ